MKTTMKKTVGLFLALIMVLGMLSMTAFAAAPSRLDITGQVPTLGETALSYKDFPIAQEDVHMGNARWVYSLAGEENYDDPHSANYGESYGNAFQPGRRYKLWLSVFMDNGVSGYFDRSVVVTYNGVPVAAENISLANQGKAVSIAIMFDPLIETVAKPVYKGDITADGVIHQISEFYDFSTLPEGTKVFRQVDEDTWVWLDAHSDLSSLEVRLPVETSFTLILPSGYVFEGAEGSNQMECTVRVLPVSYTVSFDANGGSGSMPDVTVNDGTYTLPMNCFKAPSNAKYFAGWALSADGDPILKRTITLTANTTLYATWADCEKVIDNTETVYDHSNDVYQTVYKVGDTVIDDPGEAQYLDAAFKTCEKAQAAWEITDITTGEYALKTKGEDVLTGHTVTLVGVRYISVSIDGSSSVSSYAIIKRENHYEVLDSYRTYDIYERIASVTLSAVGHTHNYVETVVPPTCTEKGYTVHICECGSTFTDRYVDALGHTEVTDNAVAPNCTATGLTEGKHCSVCGEVLVAQKTVDALGHGYVNGECSRCGAEDPNYKPIDPGKPCDGGDSCPGKDFTDMPKVSNWAHAGIDFCVKNGLFGGMSKTTFEPEGNMTRAMLVTVLWRYENSPKEGTNIFTDVKNGEWYAEAVAWAAENGIVTGVGNSRFDPNGKITREQLAAILYRYSGNKGYDTSKRGDFAPFPDKDKVSSWAADAYGWAVGEKLINGNKINGESCLDPQGNATRAQVATILMRFIQQIAK